MTPNHLVGTLLLVACALSLFGSSFVSAGTSKRCSPSPGEGDKYIKCENEQSPDMVILLTVWKRNNLEMQLDLIKQQSVLSSSNQQFGIREVTLVIFQNGEHIPRETVENTVQRWRREELWAHTSVDIHIDFIHSALETGYVNMLYI